MPDNVSAIQLLLTADPALLAIVRLSLIVSLSAVVLGGLVGGPFGAGVALTHFAARGAARILGHPVHAAGDDHRPDRAHRPDHRRADAADHRGPRHRISRRAR